MIKCYCTILFAIFCLNATGQEIFARPDAAFITRFSFTQFSSGVILLKAKVGDIPDSLNFILDTGSGGISLDSSTCTEFGIKVKKTDTTITGIGGAKKVPFVFDKDLYLPGLKVEHLNFHVTDYSVLTSVYGEKIDGIIGYSFLSRYIVKIDFENNEIEVFSPGNMHYPSGGTVLHPIFTSLPIQWLTVRDKKKYGFNFYFDTGAGLCLLMSERFVKDSSILLSRRKPVITQAEGMAGRLQMRLTLIKEVRIGPYRFKRVPVYLYDDKYNVTSYPSTGGLFGTDILKRFNVILNYPAREIHLLPNRRMREPFDYSYTGLGIYFIDGQVRVEDVIPGSPADRAFFKVGDQVIAVGNNFTNNIQTYKNLLQSLNEEIRVLIRRKEKLETLILRTQSIR